MTGVRVHVHGETYGILRVIESLSTHTIKVSIELKVLVRRIEQRANLSFVRTLRWPTFKSRLIDHLLPICHSLINTTCEGVQGKTDKRCRERKQSEYNREIKRDKLNNYT